MFTFSEAHYQALKQAIGNGHAVDDLYELMLAKGYNPSKAVFRSMFTKTNGSTLWERFWKRVNKPSSGNGCWPWIGSISVAANGVHYVPSRLSWEMIHGAIPNQLLACHKCDNPPCVNPDHIFLGTQLDNVRDMIAKGRHPSNWTIVKPSDREDAIVRLANGESAKQVAARYGVSERTVRGWRYPELAIEERTARTSRIRELRASQALLRKPYDPKAHLAAVAKHRAEKKARKAAEEARKVRRQKLESKWMKLGWRKPSSG